MQCRMDHIVLNKNGHLAKMERCSILEGFDSKCFMASHRECTMWNYRIVRKKNLRIDPKDHKEKATYTYAIHEAYYDNNGHVGSITQDPIEPFGENVEELRHSWVMMAEAFGKPILDYDNIPEPGYERKEDPAASVLDERLKAMDSGDDRGIPWEQVKRDMEERFGPFQEEEYEKRVEIERVETERIHVETFIGTATLEILINKIYADYLESRERDRNELEAKS